MLCRAWRRWRLIHARLAAAEQRDLKQQLLRLQQQQRGTASPNTQPLASRPAQLVIPAVLP